MSDKQVGGSHYQNSQYDPIWLINKLDLTFIQGNVIKYCFRAHNKNGIEDFRKALSYCDIAFDYKEREIDGPRKNLVDVNDLVTINEFCNENGLNVEFYKLVLFVYIGMYYTLKELLSKVIEEGNDRYFVS